MLDGVPDVVFQRVVGDVVVVVNVQYCKLSVSRASAASAWTFYCVEGCA